MGISGMKSSKSTELASQKISKLQQPFIKQKKMDPAANFQEITSNRSRFTKILKFYKFYGN